MALAHPIEVHMDFPPCQAELIGADVALLRWECSEGLQGRYKGCIQAVETLNRHPLRMIRPASGDRVEH